MKTFFRYIEKPAGKNKSKPPLEELINLSDFVTDFKLSIGMGTGNKTPIRIGLVEADSQENLDVALEYLGQFGAKKLKINAAKALLEAVSPWDVTIVNTDSLQATVNGDVVTW